MRRYAFLLASLFLFPTLTRGDISYDAGNDFSATSNPNGLWSFAQTRARVRICEEE